MRSKKRKPHFEYVIPLPLTRGGGFALQNRRGLRRTKRLKKVQWTFLAPGPGGALAKPEATKALKKGPDGSENCTPICSSVKGCQINPCHDPPCLPGGPEGSGGRQALPDQGGEPFYILFDRFNVTVNCSQLFGRQHSRIQRVAISVLGVTLDLENSLIRNTLHS